MSSNEPLRRRGRPPGIKNKTIEIATTKDGRVIKETAKKQEMRLEGKKKLELIELLRQQGALLAALEAQNAVGDDNTDNDEE